MYEKTGNLFLCRLFFFLFKMKIFSDLSRFGCFSFYGRFFYIFFPFSTYLFFYYK
ncbi:hypothetical protein RhiirB3_12993 [Rhizophagus irregularis]|nr:hypothetical protein RhiirB3_12993 [Rhizophagus irregularis]